MEQEQSAYITSVHLKGYKSIRDVSVTLNKGLNILIGANGSGKTNFLEFLDAAYRGDYGVLLNGKKFESTIEGNPLAVKTVGERVNRNEIRGIVFRVKEDLTYGKSSQTNIYVFDENKKLINRETTDNLRAEYFSINRFFLTTFLRFENPLNEILREKLNLNSFISFMSGTNISNNNILFDINLKSTNGKSTFLSKMFYFDNKLIIDFEKTSDIYKELYNDKFLKIDNLQQNLKQFSPIKDIKIDWKSIRQTIQIEIDGESSLIENIDILFSISNEWVNWTQLSDGTKRLFYLIGSVTYAEKNEIILIEEPELGVHPHQLALLMNFLKAQSKDKQIIISTHSPQVLNCLGEDELDRIIVARHEGKNGTILHPLSEPEIGYVSEYMKNEAFLSDYWMLSGFMDEEPVETL